MESCLIGTHTASSYMYIYVLPINCMTLSRYDLKNVHFTAQLCLFYQHFRGTETQTKEQCLFCYSSTKILSEAFNFEKTLRLHLNFSANSSVEIY